jgi:hypothetical protein
MRKAEKRKRLRLTQSTFGTTFGSVSPKFDKARLVGVQWQAEMFQPFSEVREKRCGVIFMLKSGNIIVGVSDEDDFPTGFPASPPVCPKVKTVVQVDVWEHWWYNSALRRADNRCTRYAIFHHSGFQPFAYQADDTAVTDAQL